MLSANHSTILQRVGRVPCHSFAGRPFYIKHIHSVTYTAYVIYGTYGTV